MYVVCMYSHPLSLFAPENLGLLIGNTNHSLVKKEKKMPKMSTTTAHGQSKTQHKIIQLVE